MATGDKIESGHVEGFRREISRALGESQGSFFTWFDDADDTEMAFVRGAWDFAFHIAHPLAAHLRAPESRTALEIGYGGGRLLAAASRYFGRVIGVDIHGQREAVARELERRGVTNFELQEISDSRIGCPDRSIDVVYSFIVLQHVEKIDVVRSYLREVARILAPDGIALLYFGRFVRFSENRASTMRYLADRMVARLRLPAGYRELPARVNEVNLYLTPGYARTLARSVGLRTLDVLVSRKRVPDGTRLYGGQHGLLLAR